jgi:uncharacterized membrane protein
LAILWFLFLPNSIYVITDVRHLINDWPHLTVLERTLSVMQYTVFEVTGLIAFLLALAPVEINARKMWPKKKHVITTVFIIFNILMGFALVLGNIGRVNSWEVFTMPANSFSQSINTLTTPELFGMMLLYSAFINCFYFLCGQTVYNYFKSALLDLFPVKTELTNRG